MSSEASCNHCGRVPAFGRIIWHHTSDASRRIGGKRIPLCEYCTDSFTQTFGSIPDWLEAQERHETVQVFRARKAAEAAKS